MLEIYVSAVAFMEVVQPAGYGTTRSVSAAVVLAHDATVHPPLKALVSGAAGREVYSSRAILMAVFMTLAAVELRVNS